VFASFVAMAAMANALNGHSRWLHCLASPHGGGCRNWLGVGKHSSVPARWDIHPGRQAMKAHGSVGGDFGVSPDHRYGVHSHLSSWSWKQGNCSATLR